MADDSTEQQKQLDAFLFANRKLEAIKLYRQFTHTDLKAAKDAVEAREQVLRQQSPERFSKAGCATILLLAGGTLAILTAAGLRLLC